MEDQFSTTLHQILPMMLPMHSVVISDTSCFIILSKIGELELLQKVYGKVFTTIEVAIEFNEPLPDWVVIKSVTNKKIQQLIEMQLDKGESSAITLAIETDNCLLILDDYKARKIVKAMEIKFTGTIGIIVKAKLLGIVPSIKPFLSKIRETNFRVSGNVEIEALKEAGEL